MPDLKTGLFVALGLVTAVYVAVWARAIRRSGKQARQTAPTPLEFWLGFVTNFFDTLGIGSFAPTTSAFKLRQLVPDELIPGTLNVGHAIPTVVEALIFVAIIQVDIRTLLLMIGSAVAGAWLGAGIVAAWPRRMVQIGMSGALVAAAVLFALTNIGVLPAGGNTLSLNGPRLWAGVAGNALLGALMTLGIGLYGPCIILVSILGMNPTSAFPIMMGACAFLMPVASLRFIRKGRYKLRAALGLAVGGIPGVLLAAFVVKSLPLTAVRWLVIVVVLYTAMTMIRSAMASATKEEPGMEAGSLNPRPAPPV